MVDVDVVASAVYDLDVLSDVYIGGVIMVELSRTGGTDVLILVVNPTESSVQVSVGFGAVTTGVSCELEVSSNGHGVVASPVGSGTVVNDAGVWAAEEARTEVKVLGASGAGPAGEIKPPVCWTSVPGDSSEEELGSEAAESADGACV